MTSLVLNRFSISNLFGKHNLDITIDDNIFIIVAENGSGKSTVLRILYYFLSKQWIRLLDFPFDVIVANIGEKKIKFDRNVYLKQKIEDLQIEEIEKKYPIYKDFIIRDLGKMDLLDLMRNPYKINEIESEFDVPLNLLVKIVNELTENMFSHLNASWSEIVIYLPTFRRIERDFSDLFEDIDKRLELKLKSLIPKRLYAQDNLINDEKVENFTSPSIDTELTQLFTELWNSRDLENWRKREVENYHIELVEFGMSDVKYQVKNYLSKIEKFDKENYKSEIIDKFIHLCNKYLISNEVFVFKRDLLVKSKSGDIVDLSDLSSGEKQIISIFSHICLSKKKPILIIDEPELSLSVTWQESLLNDILQTGVLGLFVATHSPFIVSEELKNNTHGLKEFKRP